MRSRMTPWSEPGLGPRACAVGSADGPHGRVPERMFRVRPAPVGAGRAQGSCPPPDYHRRRSMCATCDTRGIAPGGPTCTDAYDLDVLKRLYYEREAQRLRPIELTDDHPKH